MTNNTTNYSYERQPEESGVAQRRRWVVATGTNTLKTYLTYQYPDVNQPEVPEHQAELKTNVAQSMNVVGLSNRFEHETMPQAERDQLTARISVERALQSPDTHEYPLSA